MSEMKKPNIGSMLAGYLYPNTSEELTTAVEKFEES